MKQKKIVSRVVSLIFLMSVLSMVSLLLISCTGKDENGKSTSKTTVKKKANPPSDFKYDLTKDGKGIKITEILGEGVDIVIPDTIEDMPVTELEFFGYNSGRLNTKIKSGEQVWNNYLKRYVDVMKPVNSIVVPPSVNIIGESCFFWVKGVDIDISKLKKIGRDAFAGTEFVNTSITISKDTEFPGPGEGGYRTTQAFYGSNITSVTLEEGRKELFIGFAGCKNLENVIIPSSIKKMSEYEFEDCPRLSLKTRQAIKDAGYKGSF